MLSSEERNAIVHAVAEAQRAGHKQSRPRAARIGGQEIEGAAFRWVEVDDPPVVYFPDARPSRWSWASAGMTVLYVVAFLSLAFAILSATLSDWLFLAIFGAASVVSGVAGYRLDVAISRKRAAAAEGVERRGLYLTPEALMLVTHRDTIVVPRRQVRRFRAKNVANASEDGARFRELVEVDVGGRSQTLRLQDGIDSQQRAYCETWLDGRWPLPLPQ